MTIAVSFIRSISAPDPFDLLQLTVSTIVAGSSLEFGTTVYVAFDASSEDINGAIVHAVIEDAMSTHSIEVGAVRLFGGAMARL